MASLMNCIECGGAVSNNAEICPHCRKHPRPVRCRLCHKDALIESSVQFDLFNLRLYDATTTGYSSDVRHIYFHKSCLSSHFPSHPRDSDQFACPACSALYYYKDFDKEIRRSPCKECGHPLSFIDCRCCGKQLEVDSLNSSVEQDPGYGRKFYHPSCKKVTEYGLAVHKQTKFQHGNDPNPRASANNDSCYIATAVYKDVTHPKVILLRRFRDRVLLSSWWGRLITSVYYSTSPPIAKILVKYPRIGISLKLLALEPFISIIQRKCAIAVSIDSSMPSTNGTDHKMPMMRKPTSEALEG